MQLHSLCFPKHQLHQNGVKAPFRFRFKDQIKSDEVSQERLAREGNSRVLCGLLSGSEGVFLMSTTNLWRPLAGMELRPCEVRDSQHTESRSESTVCQVGGGAQCTGQDVTVRTPPEPLARRNSL